jgi:serine/threonine protein kinase
VRTQGLGYIHSKGYMFRDLKPENLLLDTSGYLKITDYGFAKKLEKGKSFTMCGTPDYLVRITPRHAPPRQSESPRVQNRGVGSFCLEVWDDADGRALWLQAPELLEQCGHNQAVDWWAMGVLVYEMCTLETPFQSNDDMQRYKNIQNLAIDWKPAAQISADGKDLIKRFLVKNPAKRLGSGSGGLAKIKAHAWFKGFDWAALEARTMKAPYVPPLKSAMDVSMFEPVEDDGVPGMDDTYSSAVKSVVRDPATWESW